MVNLSSYLGDNLRKRLSMSSKKTSLLTKILSGILHFLSFQTVCVAASTSPIECLSGLDQPIMVFPNSDTTVLDAFRLARRIRLQRTNVSHNNYYFHLFIDGKVTGRRL